MNAAILQSLPAPLLMSLLRTGLVLTVSALALSAFLRAFRVASPRLRRAAYVAVLVQGWLFLQGPFAVSFAVTLPSFLEAAVTKAPPDVNLRGTPSTLAEENVDLGIVAGQSLETILAEKRERMPSRPRTKAASADVHQGQGSEPWSANEWNASTSPSDEPVRASNGFARPPRAMGMAPELRSLVWHDDDRPAHVEPLESSSSPFPWTLALVGMWAAGIAVLVGRAAWNYARVIRQMPPLSQVDAEWTGEWTELQRQAGVRRLVPLAVAEHAGPVLFRLPRGYRLIVPAAAWRTLDRSQRLAILRHELAHIVRRDVWKSLAVRVLALPHWFNPLAWILVHRFDECAEWACDEAARRAAPDEVPDYARALLQLVQRAEPVFFATRAAREHGLSHRIRRLLTPAQEKGSAMKTAVLFALVLGISLTNLTRLQSRAGDDSPKTVDVTVTAAPQVAGSTLTVTATPAAAQSASTAAAPAAAAPVANAAPAIATTPVSLPASAASSSAVLTITAAPTAAPATAAAPTAAPATAATPAAVPATTATPKTPTTPSAAPARPVSIIVGVTPSAAATAQPATTPAAAAAPSAMPASADPTVPTIRVRAFSDNEPRQARADLGAILKQMTEFDVRHQALEAENRTWRQLRDLQQKEMARTVRDRIAAEKDPLIKDMLEKGIAIKTMEMAKEVDPKLAGRAKQLRNEMLSKVVAEIARYAQEHHLLVVRRADYVRQNEAYLGDPTPRALNIVTSDRQMQASFFDQQKSTPGKSYGIYLSVDAPAKMWDQEVLYVRDNQHEVDISDEIVKRLNAAYTAEKKP